MEYWVIVFVVVGLALVLTLPFLLTIVSAQWVALSLSLMLMWILFSGGALWMLAWLPAWGFWWYRLRLRCHIPYALRGDCD